MKSMIALILAFLFLGANYPSYFVNGTVYDTEGNTLQGVTVSSKDGSSKSATDVNGFYTIEIASGSDVLVFSTPGFKTREVKVGNRRIVDVTLRREIPKPEAAEEELSEDVSEKKLFKSQSRFRALPASGAASYDMSMGAPVELYPNFNTEDYATIHDNEFRRVLDIPLSTFSIDVDAASYSNVRRFLNMGQLPPKDAVRIEEMINYFTYGYEKPTGDDPFSINTEITKTPWNEDHMIVQIGLQGRKIPTANLPASNLVFLIDVSGSMQAPNKLPLLKSSLKMLTNELRSEDKVSIVVYAGAAGLVLPPTKGNNKKDIIDALNKLSAGGSTAGGAGIKLAYKVAKEQFIDGGNNRIIIATDGDFNVGESSNAAMERLIEEKRKEGIFLTVLGYGMGNHKDSKMEILADKGNGNYAYIDNIREAKKVLVNEFGGTLFTIAKDVKIQVEFNPVHVQAYRLIGYENRKLNAEDFNDDKKDAGELGSGHTVTALYEIIPTGVTSEFVKTIDPLKYQANRDPDLSNEDELLTVKFRYKEPDGEKSKLIAKSLEYVENEMSENLAWSAAVAGFGMLLRNSEFKGDLDYNKVLTLAKRGTGQDKQGYRKEFIELVDIASRMDQSN